MSTSNQNGVNRSTSLLETEFAQNRARVRFRVENAEDALPHGTWVFTGIDAGPDASVLVVSYYWACLIVICAQSLLQYLGVVVGSLDQRLAGDVVLHRFLGRVEDLVVGSTRGRMNQTAGDSINEQLILYLQFDGMFQRLVAGIKHVVETLGLGDCSWETIQDKSELLSAICNPLVVLTYPF